MLPERIAEIEAALSEPLPGWQAQRQMLPAARFDDEHRYAPDSGYREAAVLLLLYPATTNDDWQFVLIRRPTYNGTHSGQIALPGGAREAAESLQETALREAQEEVGIDPAGVTMLGQLSSLYILPSNFLVYPFIGFSQTAPVFQPDAREVAEIIQPSLISLLDPSTRKSKRTLHREMGWTKIPFFHLLGHRVWGATAMMLNEFVQILEKNRIVTER